jgi:hypothetical protein
MGCMRLLIQAAALLATAFVIRLISYNIHPLNDVNTFWGAIAVAFSFWPGILLGYLALHLQRVATREKDENQDPPAAALICALLWFVYLFRAATLLIHLPALSNWTQAPVDAIVKFLGALP